jgi:sulfur carrier protein ThiS
MATQTNTTIRMFGALHTFRKDHGLDSTTEVTIPPEGRTAYDLARDLDLPMDKVEAVFVNHIVYNLQQVVKPGDRVAFVPKGIPSPSYFLGLNRR